jgi:ABC-type transporter MlaC component
MSGHGPSIRAWLPAIVGVLAFCLMSLLTGGAARADDAGARAFIQTNVNDGIAIMNDTSLSKAAQKQKVRALLATLLDTRKIGLFALGKARGKASQADIDAYVAAFNKFMIESYVTRLDGYGGQSLKVTGVIDHAPGDYVVTAVMVDPGSPNDPNPVHVMFRVLQEGEHYKVVDASIVGVWLGLAQRDDFVGFLGHHGDSVALLTAHLKEMTAKFDAPKNASKAAAAAQ